MCFGQSGTTEDLNNRVMGSYDPKVYGQYANAWFRKYTLTHIAASSHPTVKE